MRRWRGDVMHLSPLLQGGSSVWSHLMKINLILSLSHLPRIETSAAVSDNCSCWKLSSYDTCALRASVLMRVWVSSEALVRPVFSGFSGHFYTTLSPGNRNVFPLCFPKRSVITQRRCENDVRSHRSAIFNGTLAIYTVLTDWNKHLPAGQSIDPADQHFVGGMLTTLEQLTADTVLSRQL